MGHIQKQSRNCVQPNIDQTQLSRYVMQAVNCLTHVFHISCLSADTTFCPRISSMPVNLIVWTVMLTFPNSHASETRGKLAKSLILTCSVLKCTFHSVWSNKNVVEFNHNGTKSSIKYAAIEAYGLRRWDALS